MANVWLVKDESLVTNTLINPVEITTNDEVAKSFSIKKMIAKVKLLPSHLSNQALSNFLFLGHFLQNEEVSFIYYRNKILNLARYAYILLKTYINLPNQFFVKAQLIENVWQDNLVSMGRTIDTRVNIFRQKLAAINLACEQPILTHRGLGYSLSI
ncbi:winged helix-turn-helix domain-containing protein [Orbus wheelerorum]|uniref:winged helix-turn-helix domain-containing protein n=1 Tax=Orbus wheelerorum TaxID=3074111 RepID=UPI00370D74B6